MWYRRVREFIRETSGTVQYLTALGATAIVGLTGISVDVGHWYTTKRTMQAAADGAAMAGAFEVARGATLADIQTRAKDVAQANGYPPGSVVINWPPTSGPNAGNNRYVEAIIQQPTLGFAHTVINAAPANILARAVATTAGTKSCVYALDPSASGALEVTGTATVDLDCGALVNSNHASAAINQTGTSCLNAESIYSVGGATGTCLNPTPSTGMQPIEDPFAYLTPPTVGACDHPAKVTVTGIATLNPGVYCGGLEIQGSADVTFTAGLYIIDDIGLHIMGGAEVDGSNVTFYFPPTATGPTSGPPADKYKVVEIAGGADVDLSAPTTGTYAGVLFYQDPGSPTNTIAYMAGGANMELTGSLYFPVATVQYAGNTTSGAEWTTVVGRIVQFVGTSHMTGGSPTTNAPLALSQASLAE